MRWSDGRFGMNSDRFKLENEMLYSYVVCKSVECRIESAVLVRLRQGGLLSRGLVSVSLSVLWSL
jgi:hypothetical protein